MFSTIAGAGPAAVEGAACGGGVGNAKFVSGGGQGVDVVCRKGDGATSGRLPLPFHLLLRLVLLDLGRC